VFQTLDAYDKEQRDVCRIGFSFFLSILIKSDDGIFTVTPTNQVINKQSKIAVFCGPFSYS
jgi:hypothetical protein